jgi:hypothetical protein
MNEINQNNYTLEQPGPEQESLNSVGPKGDIDPAAGRESSKAGWISALSDSLRELRQTLLKAAQTGGLAGSSISRSASDDRTTTGDVAQALHRASRELERSERQNREEAIHHFAETMVDRLGVLGGEGDSKRGKEVLRKIHRECLKKITTSLQSEKKKQDFPSKAAQERILIYCLQARRAAGLEAAELGGEASRVREATEGRIARSGVVLSEVQGLLEAISTHNERAARDHIAKPLNGLQDLGVRVLQRGIEDTERVAHFFTEQHKLLLRVSDRSELNIGQEVRALSDALVQTVMETGRYGRETFESDLASLGRLFKRVLDEEQPHVATLVTDG